MSLIGDILPLTHIVLDMEVSSKKRLFEQIGLLLENENGLPRADIFDCLFAREKLGTTGLGQGVAIPHGRHACIKKAIGVFVRVKDGVSFDSPDGKPVTLVMALLVPENACSEHLEVLSKLAGKFSSKPTRDALLSTQDVAQVHRLLTEE
ncbi:MAG: PTS sugar transporter subunit IIA [Neisseria sp.]|nr:PTS sugar transporter subunit IIA [Neisseria sp.]